MEDPEKLLVAAEFHATVLKIFGKSKEASRNSAIHVAAANGHTMFIQGVLAKLEEL